MHPGSRSARLTIYAILAAILYLPALGRPALWEPDEGRYAEIAREMVASRDFVTPRDDYELYFEKPPLVYWAEAASIDAFGVNEFAVRFPAAIFSIGQVVVTAALADAMLGAAAGFLAALVLALSPLFFGFARFATLDPALAFSLTSGLSAFYAASLEDSFSSLKARRWMLMAAAMLALGTLAKGPVALFLGGVIALTFLVLNGGLRRVAAMPLISCAIVYAAIVVPWFVAISIRNPGFLEFFFVHEHLERYVSSTEHGWGPWFFIPILIGGTWPWIFFVPLGWSTMRRADDSAERSRRQSFATFLAVWFAIVFVFFSIPRSKLGSYILPALPPLSIVAGFGLASISSLAHLPRRRLLTLVAIANLLLAAAAFIFAWRSLAPMNPPLALDAFLIADVLAAGALTLYWLGRDASHITYAVAALAIAMLATVPLATRMREDASPISTYRNLANTVRPYLSADCTLASYRHYVQSLPFYTGHRETRVEYWGELSEVAPQTHQKSPFILGSEARLQQAWSSGSCMVLIANDRDLKPLQESLKPVPIILGCEGKKLALYNGSLAPPPDATNCFK